MRPGARAWTKTKHGLRPLRPRLVRVSREGLQLKANKETGARSRSTKLVNRLSSGGNLEWKGSPWQPLRGNCCGTGAAVDTRARFEEEISGSC